MVFIKEEWPRVELVSWPIMAYTDTLTKANAVPMPANNSFIIQKLPILGTRVHSTPTNTKAPIMAAL